MLCGVHCLGALALPILATAERLAAGESGRNTEPINSNAHSPDGRWIRTDVCFDC